MIADVGDMLKVSGSRMATPLAPPRPGSTPMMTPSRMPTIIRPMFCHCSTTAKPWNRLPMSSMSQRPSRSSSGPFGSGTRNHHSKVR